jgi:hypothetical protein
LCHACLCIYIINGQFGSSLLQTIGVSCQSGYSVDGGLNSVTIECSSAGGVATLNDTFSQLCTAIPVSMIVEGNGCTLSGGGMCAQSNNYPMNYNVYDSCGLRLPFATRPVWTVHFEELVSYSSEVHHRNHLAFIQVRSFPGRLEIAITLADLPWGLVECWRKHGSDSVPLGCDLL